MGNGSGAESIIKLLVSNFDVLAGPVVSLLYPLYASVRAIESKSPVDDQQWLTYWVLYSMITLFELTFATVIEWFPFWSYAKLIFTCWLVMPQFSGAAYVYQHYVRPYIVTRQKSVNIWFVPRKKDIFGKHDDIITAAEKHLHAEKHHYGETHHYADKHHHDNGPNVFEKMIHRFKDTTSRSDTHNHHNNNFSHHSNDYSHAENDYRY